MIRTVADISNLDNNGTLNSELGKVTMGIPNIKSTYSKLFKLKKWFPYFKTNADDTNIYIVLKVLVEFIIQKKAVHKKFYKLDMFQSQVISSFMLTVNL